MKRRLNDDADESSSSLKGWIAEVLESRKVELLIVFLVLCDVVLVLVEAGVEEHIICVGGRVAVCPEALPAVGAVSVDPLHGGSLMGLPGPALAGARRRLGRPAAAGVALAVELPKRMLQQQPHHAPHHAPEAHSHGHEHQAHGHEPGAHGHGGEHAAAHGGHGGGHGGLCPHPGEPVLVCDTRNGHHAKHLVHICHVLSVSILCVFVVELSLKWWSNPEEFISNFYHKLDLAVTVISLIIDTVVISVIHSYEEGGENKSHEMESLYLLSALIILARTWRIVRICHGLFEEIHSVAEVDEENKRLKEALSSAGLDEHGHRLGSGVH